MDYYKKKEKIPKEILIELYTMMKRIRLVQLEIEKEYPKDEMKTPVHLCLGQEAIPAGVCINLNTSDRIFSNHRGHGHYIAKGGDLKSMIAELHCKATGCSGGRGGSMHLIDTSVGFMGSSSIVGGSIPIATGSALSSILRNDKQVSVVFFGDAASEEGVLFESMNFAALKRLPVVYVCENNFYSVCSHQSARQANCDISMRPKAFDIPSYQVDGADVMEVYSASKKAVKDARSGKGPSFLECRAYRWRGHAGAGDPQKDLYRKSKEWAEWMKKDPLKNFEKTLIKEKTITNKEIKAISEKISDDIAAAFGFAKSSLLPDKRELEKYLLG